MPGKQHRCQFALKLIAATSFVSVDGTSYVTMTATTTGHAHVHKKTHTAPLMRASRGATPSTSLQSLQNKYNHVGFELTVIWPSPL